MTTYKSTILFLAFVVNSILSFSQQVPHYTQYLYNMQIVNPAAVGLRSDLNISLLSRSQWVGVEGAPSTQTLSLNARSVKGLGFGFTVINDKIGLTKSTNTNIDISYTIITNERSRLALGLKGGANFFSNDLASGITPDNEIYQSTTGTYPNIGFGAMYYNDWYFVGLSIPYLLKSSEFTIETSEVTELTNSLNYFFTGGVKFYINDDLEFKPTTLIKYTTNLPLSIDINANALYMKKYEAGLSYRYNDSLSIMLAYVLSEKIRFGYAYEHKFTDFGNNLSTHEILINFDLNLKRQGRWLQHNSCYF